MILLSLIGCALRRESGDADSAESAESADSAVLEERVTTLHAAADVSAVLSGELATGVGLGGDLLGSGIPTVLVWGCADYIQSEKWEEEVFLSVYPGDLVGRNTLSLDHGTHLVVPAEECSSSVAMDRPVGSSDLTGDGSEDLLVTTVKAGGGIQLFAGPLLADGAWPAAVATITFALSPWAAPKIDAADLDGDGVDEVMLFSNGYTGDGRLVILDTPLSGAIDANEAVWRLPFQEYCLTYASTHGDVDGDGYGDLALACNAQGYLLKGPFTNAAMSLEDAASTYIFDSDVSHSNYFFGSVAILDGANDAGEVALGVPGAKSPYAGAAAGVVLLYDSLPGTHDVEETTGKIWGDFACGRLGQTLAVGRMNEDGYDDLWMGAPGPGFFDDTCSASDEALWGLRGPLRGEILASHLDEGFLNNGALGEAFIPHGLAVGDLDGTSRDDLAVWNGSDVLLVRW